MNPFRLNPGLQTGERRTNGRRHPQLGRFRLPSFALLLLFPLALTGCESRPSTNSPSTPEAPSVAAARASRSNSPAHSDPASRTSHPRRSPAARSARTTSSPATLSAPDSPRLEITGLVVVGDTFAHASDAEIWLSPADDETSRLAEARTNSAGAFRLQLPLPDIPLVLYARHPRYAREAAALPHPVPSAYPGQDVHLKLRLLLQPSSTVAGLVADASGKPLAGASVQLSRLQHTPLLSRANESPQTATLQTWQAVTGADGRFSLTDLPAGPISVEATSTGYLPEKQSVHAPAANLQFTLDAQGVGVLGHVFDQSTGSGVPGVAVRLTEASAASAAAGNVRAWNTTTDQLGEFLFTDLPEGTYRLSGSKDHLVLRNQDTLAGNELKLSASETTRELTLYLYPGQTVTGRVTEAETGRPLEDVEVTALGEFPKSTRTASDGTYSLSGLAPSGNALWGALQFKKSDYVVKTDDPDSPELVRLDGSQEAVTKNMVLIPVLTISGRVVTESGLGIPAAIVSIRPPSDVETVQSGPDGQFELKLKPYNNLILHARASGYGIGYSKTLWNDGKSTSGVEIVVRAAGAVEGMVIDDQGAPVPKCQVQVLAPQEIGPVQPISMGNANESGIFQFSALPAGSLSLVAHPSTNELVQSKPETIQLSPGETRKGIRLALRKTRPLAVLVTDQQGLPVSAAHVYARSTHQNDNAGTGGQSDQQGRLTLQLPAAPSYHITARAAGFEPLQLENVSPDQPDLTLVLPPARPVTILGSVLDARTSEPVAQFEVYNRLPNETRFQPGIQPDGKVEFQNQAPGIFTLNGFDSGDTVWLLLRAPGYLDSIQNPLPLRIEEETGDAPRTLRVEYLLQPQ